MTHLSAQCDTETATAAYGNHAAGSQPRRNGSIIQPALLDYENLGLPAMGINQIEPANTTGATKIG